MDLILAGHLDHARPAVPCLDVGTMPETSDLETLRRWEASGAVWRIADRRPGSVEIALLTCDGGEEVGRLLSSDPALLDYVGSWTGSDDPLRRPD
jgi:hypothetical protein